MRAKDIFFQTQAGEGSSPADAHCRKFSKMYFSQKASDPRGKI